MPKFMLIFLLFPLLSSATQPIKVVTTTSIFKDMIESIGGNLVEVHSIVPLGSDPHRYEAKPSDVTICREADIIFINGLHLEVWIEKLIQNSRTKAKTVLLTQGIKSISTGRYPDPHAWMNAANGIYYVNNIAETLIRIRPDQKTFITNNLIKYSNTLRFVDNYIKNKMLKIPETSRILITNHDAFRYFGLRYGLRLVPLMGVSTEAEPKTSDIIKIIHVIQESKVPAIFIETSVNPQLMKQIADDAGIRIGGSLFSDSLGPPESDADTYIGMLKKNAETIFSSLQPKNAEAKGFNLLPQTSSVFMFLMIIIFLISLTGFFAYRIS
ncbi:MAG: zinc ABC transporter substrate-binding protein [Saprospiraceae bacterium]|nr:zinc ABC transporter substrate-binding protein [Saprospiraceae bacterium]